MTSLILSIDAGAIITGLIDSSPTLAVAGLFGWYMHKQLEKKDAAIAASELVKAELTERLINGKESQLISEQKQLALLEKIIDKTGGIPIVVKEGVERLAKNQEELKNDIKDLKSVIKP